MVVQVPLQSHGSVPVLLYILMRDGIATFKFHNDEEIVDVPPVRLPAVQLQEISHQLRLSLILETKNDHQDEGAAQEEQREGPREVG